MRVPMPSPRGTNREQLFVTAHHPAAAYDDATGGSLNDDKIQKLIEFCAGKLSDADMETLKELLMNNSEEAMDDLSGKPKAGGPVALDARRARSLASRSSTADADFARRYPGVARIKVSY